MKQTTYTFMVALGFSAICSLASIPFSQGTSAAEAEVVAPVETLAPYVEPEATPVPDRCLNPETSSVDCFPNATPVPDTCWDCLGNTLTDEETLLLVCSPESLAENPQHFETCYEDEWIYSCDPDGWCEFDEGDDPTGEGYDW
jgi:hypothetical protein